MNCFRTLSSILFCWVFLSAGLLNANAQSLPPANPSAPLFEKNLVDHSDFGKIWDENDNGGKIAIGSDSISLQGNGTGYPVLKTQKNPFPSSGDWTVSFGYRYTSIGAYGVGIICGDDKDNVVFRVHQDVDGQFIQLNGKNLFTAKPNIDWHVISFLRSNESLTAYLDGKQVGTGPCPLSPSNLKIGGGIVSVPGAWNDLEIQFIQLSAGQHMLDKTVLHNGDMGSLPLSSNPEPGQVQYPLRWSTTDGDQYLEAIGTGLHLRPRTSGSGPRLVTATSKLSLPDTHSWQASFDIRFGIMKDQASSLHLTRDGHDVGWVGADGVFKGMGVFIGKDNEVESSTADMDWHHISFVSNNNTLIALLDGKQIGSGTAQNIPDNISVMNEQEMSVPCHQDGVWVRNVSVSNGVQPVTQASSFVDSHAAPPSTDAIAIPLRSADTNVTCLVGDRINIAGSVTMEGTFDSCLLMADGTVAATRTPSIPTDDYSFTWTPKTVGTHALELRYTNLHSKVTARRLLVTADDTPPAVISDLPGSAATDTRVTVSGSSDHPFPLARVEFYFNDKPVGAVTAAPFAATLPVEQITQPGNYPVRFIAYDAAGHPFHSHSSFITIPQRVQVTAPRTFTSRNAGDKANLTASVLPGIKVAKISYAIVHANVSDYQTIADVSSSPFTADVDLSSRASGDYWVKATVTTAAGNSYEAYAVPLTLTNVPDDNRKVQEAKDKAEADAKAATIASENAKRQVASDHDAAERAANLQVFAPRPGFDEAIFRDQLMRLASYAPELRKGTLGTVHALAVLTINDEIVTGIPFTISALVRPGSGQVNFLANAAEDTKIAVQQAAEYCKMLTAPQQWDWSKYDLTVGYDQNDIKSSGPSAGLADAVAILSCSFKLPVDNSVAMTGAVTLQGQVQPVGGVDFKAEAAFNDPAIHTIIVPAGTVSSEDLTRLYISEPALCFSRRVVMVNTVEEAAKEAIVGWSHSNYMKEENLVQGGLRHFAKGEDMLAVAAFQAAHDIDPNNWTASFWIAMIDLVHKQHAEDAMAAQTAANNKIFGIK